ncbi:unnamed protein product [Closterium sp. NIES-54]
MLLRNCIIDNHNTWYLDSCCGQHMVGSVRYISNTSHPLATYVKVANNEQLRASAQSIMVLQARNSNTHISFNDVLFLPDLRFNLLTARQLRDCGVMLATDPYTRDLILTYAPPDTPPESHKYLGRARSINGIYLLDVDIPSFQASSDVVDPVPLDFSYLSKESWQHPDGRLWIRRSHHPEEINLHQPGPDDIFTTCFTPMASRTEEVERDLAAIREAESADAEPTGMTEMELAVTTHRVFGIGDERLGLMEQQRPTPQTETLCWILEEAHGTTFDEENRPRPYARDVYCTIINKAWKDPDAKEELSVKELEEQERAEKKAKLYEECIAAGWDEESARTGGWGGDDEGTGATWGSATGASCTVQGWETGG